MRASEPVRSAELAGLDTDSANSSLPVGSRSRMPGLGQNGYGLHQQSAEAV